MSDLTTAALQRLYRAAHNRLQEDFAASTQDTIERETARLLDLEATKIIAQCSLIINGSGSSTDKIGELCSLLLRYDDPDEEDANVSSVDVHPTARD